MTDQITVGTISFARWGEQMELAPKERVRLILAAACAYGPDLLVTAGYAIHKVRHLDRLARQMSGENLSTTIITEVHHDEGATPAIPYPHALWCVRPNGDAHRLGPQVFATSRDARRNDNKLASQLCAQLPERMVAVKQWSVLTLCCGELNLIHGRNQPRWVHSEAGERASAADIIVNPTHDRMGNAGTLDAKRRFLSRPADGRNRLYVSCSNWEAWGDETGRVQYPSPTLHTVYRSGEPLPYDEYADGSFGFVYRHWSVSM